MKAIKMRIQNPSRWTAMLLAIFVAILTCVTVANATQTITTPNAAFISYNLGSDADSAAITPASNRPVLVMGCATNSNIGVGQVSLIHTPGLSIIWVGLESWNGTSTAFTSGGGSAAGLHILWINYDHSVQIEVSSADTIRIHNGSAFTQTGNVTLMW